MQQSKKCQESKILSPILLLSQNKWCLVLTKGSWRPTKQFDGGGGLNKDKKNRPYLIMHRIHCPLEFWWHKPYNRYFLQRSDHLCTVIKSKFMGREGDFGWTKLFQVRYKQTKSKIMHDFPAWSTLFDRKQTDLCKNISTVDKDIWHVLSSDKSAWRICDSLLSIISTLDCYCRSALFHLLIVAILRCCINALLTKALVVAGTWCPLDSMDAIEPQASYILSLGLECSCRTKCRKLWCYFILANKGRAHNN